MPTIALSLLVTVAVLSAADVKPPSYQDPGVKPGDTCWAVLSDGRRFLGTRSSDGATITEVIIREKQVGAVVQAPPDNSIWRVALGNPGAAVALVVPYDSARLVEPGSDRGTDLPDLALVAEAPIPAQKLLKEALELKTKKIPEARKRWADKRSGTQALYQRFIGVYPEFAPVLIWAFPSWVDLLPTSATLQPFEFLRVGARGGVGVETQNSLRAREMWIEIQAKRKEMIAAAKGITDGVLRYMQIRADIDAQGWLVKGAAP